MTLRPVPYSTDTQCPVCQTNPFDDPTISSYSWNGHFVVTGSGTESERRIIHGICARCLPNVPRNEQFLRCFTCRMPFPDERRSEIVVNRDGTLISETLLPATNRGNQAPPVVGNAAPPRGNLGAPFPGWQFGFFGAGAAGGIATGATAIVASLTTTTIVVPAANVAVHVTVWTTTTIAATAVAPVLGAITVGAMAIGFIGLVGVLIAEQRRTLG